MKVMTFNILGATVRAESQPWDVRGPQCVELIKRHAPDVLAVQELEPGNFETFVIGLDDFEYRLGPVGAYKQIGYQSKNAHNYNAVYWNPNMLSALDSGEFWLSETPERPSQDWGANLVAGTNWIRFRRNDSVEFLFLNTHLDKGPELARTRSAQLILKQVACLRRTGETVILCGDMNDAPGYPAYRAFESGGLQDVFRKLGNTDKADDFTIHLFKGPSFSPVDHGFNSSRIDQIWTMSDENSALSPRTYSLIRDNTNGQYPSDHYPVVVEFR